MFETFSGKGIDSNPSPVILKISLNWDTVKQYIRNDTSDEYL